MTEDRNLTFEDDGALLTVMCRGELDLTAEDHLVGSVTAAIAAAPTISAVVVDLSEVTFMDSSGLRALLTCRERAMGRDLTFSISAYSDAVRRLLEVAGVSDWFSSD